MSKRIEIYGDGIGRVELVDHLGSDLTVVNSARVSFGAHKEALDKKDKKLINYLIKHQHTSTLEHCVATFYFKVPLYVRSQHHRHRTWSYNEISRRYTSESLEFYEPTDYRIQHENNRQASRSGELKNPLLSFGTEEWGYSGYAPELVKKYHQNSVTFYRALLRAGICREQARGVLPQNLYTEYYGTVNLHNALKFCASRLHEGAQWEIQQVAMAMLSIMRDLWPITVQSWIKNLEDPKLRKAFLADQSPKI